MPATVQAILAARIDRLPPEDKALLQTAAVIGKDVPFPLLQAIAEVSEDALRDGLGRLQAHEFLYETALFSELEYTFKHALTAHATLALWALPGGGVLDLELWDERHLLRLLGERFGVALAALGDDDLLALRAGVDRTKGIYAFADGFQNDPLQATLLWHLAFWRIRQLREAGRPTSRAILPPGLYRDVVVVMADFCSYSSYVRDTRDEVVSRRWLTSFASKTRYRVINGVPEGVPGYVGHALECARGLVDIGASVATGWQRQIDQLQPAAGVHVSMTLGDLQVLSLRPLSRTHMGVIGDSINLAARLNGVAGCDEIVVSNMLHQRLPDDARAKFLELASVDAKHIGRVRAWKLGPLGTAGA